LDERQPEMAAAARRGEGGACLQDGEREERGADMIMTRLEARRIIRRAIVKEIRERMAEEPPGFLVDKYGEQSAAVRLYRSEAMRCATRIERMDR